MFIMLKAMAAMLLSLSFVTVTTLVQGVHGVTVEDFYACFDLNSYWRPDITTVTLYSADLYHACD